ncbi:MAG: tripartite tricarboxylate transporter substrate binding protein [Dongiaceae bacterium]
MIAGKLVGLALSSALGFGVLAGAAGASAAEYPLDDVTLVTHSSPGGGTDVFLREMILHLAPAMGANFVVENVRGGGGAKAMAKLATSPADGSIFYGTTPSYINASLLSKPDYTFHDLDPVVNVFIDPQLLYVRNDSPYKTLTDVVNDAKARPNQVKIAVSTPASLDRQVVEQLKQVAGVELITITHDGGGDTLLSVLNGTGDVGVGEAQELRGQIDAGEIRLITTYTEKRLEQFPDVPTAREQGFDLVANKFRGIAGPKGLPADVVKAWEEGIQKVLADPKFKAWYEQGALVPAYMPQAEYRPFIENFAKEEEAFFVKYNITEE